MNMMHCFDINCVPPKSTHQAGLRIMKNSSGQMFVGRQEKSKSRQAQNDLMQLLSNHRPPGAPIMVPIRLSIVWRYPWCKTETKKNIALGVLPCTTRPDCDNLIKGLSDCMSRLRFWGDDSQVYRLDFMKVWTSDPGIRITMEWVDNNSSSVLKCTPKNK